MSEQPPARLSSATVVLFAAFVGLFIAQIFTIRSLRSTDRSLRSTETRLAAIQADQSKVREAFDGELAKLHEAAASSDAERQKALDSVLDSVSHEVEKAQQLSQQEARGVANKVKEETTKSVDELASRLSASESRVKQHQDAEARVTTDLTNLQQATSSAQTEVATTQVRLERTIADLKRTTGDMGMMSGLIATNSKEIGALKQLDDRDYTEFTLYKGKEPIRLADISILLKKADVKGNRYTLELHVDDRKIEKKDRSTNEPVQFYVGVDRQPHELVINQVGKDQIVGYLATPKARLLH